MCSHHSGQLHRGPPRPTPPHPTPASPQQPSCTFLWSARRAMVSFPRSGMTGWGCMCNPKHGRSSQPRAQGSAPLSAPNPSPERLPSRLLLHVGPEPRASLWPKLGSQPQMGTPSYTGPVGPPKLRVFAGRHLAGVLGDLRAPVATELGSRAPWRCQGMVDFSRVRSETSWPHHVLDGSWG